MKIAREDREMIYDFSPRMLIPFPISKEKGSP